MAGEDPPVVDAHALPCATHRRMPRRSRTPSIRTPFILALSLTLIIGLLLLLLLLIIIIIIILLIVIRLITLIIGLLLLLLILLLIVTRLISSASER